MTDSTASRYRYLPTLLIILGLSWLASPAALADETGSTADQQRLEWNFKVYLDDSPIGFHRFSLSGDQQQRQLVTEADFQVKFLFITAYRYQHQNTETWQGDCLERLESRTDANGKATVQIEVPDNLTRYRVMAVAVAGLGQPTGVDVGAHP